MSMDPDRLTGLLRQGPPDEAAYDLPPLGVVAPLAGRVRQSAVRLHAAPRERRVSRAWGSVVMLGLAAVVIVGSATVLVIGAGPVTLNTVRPSLDASQPIDRKSGQPTIPPVDASFTADGWPVSIPRIYGESTAGTVGPDGSLYVAGPKIAAAIDPTGHLRPGWPIKTPIDRPVHMPVIAPDGSILVANDSAVVDIDQSGEVRPGWPLTFTDGMRGPFVGPNGSTVIVATLPSGRSELIGLSLASPTPKAWTSPVPGSLADTPQYLPDGTIVLPLDRGPGQADGTVTLVAFRTDRSSPSLWSSSGWSAMAPSPTGELAVWSYALAPNASLPAVRATHLALLGSDGRALPGWPRVFDGPMSAPAFSTDGTLFMVSGSADHRSTATLLAIDRAGQTKPGWPARLPTGCDGLSAVFHTTDLIVAQTPGVSADGRVFLPCVLASGVSIWAFDADGLRAPGWPYGLAAGTTLALIGGPLVGGDGLVYLNILGPDGSSVVAIPRDGAPSGGWTHGLASVVLDWTPLSSGGLVAQWEDPGSREMVVTKFTVSGPP